MAIVKNNSYKYNNSYNNNKTDDKYSFKERYNGLA